MFYPPIAIAIGVLTSNRGGGRRTNLADWWGAVHAAPFGCHRRVPLNVLWLGGRRVFFFWRYSTVY